ncbi:hypothetical protein HQ447_05055, partial [bacterium]|nr:hypothetical protein [bacterium]
ADTDGDGFKDGQEIALGRNPLKIEMDFTLGSLSQGYDGAPKSATANTIPAGLPVKYTYDGTDALPTQIGSYAVVGTIDDATYVGSASGTLVISKGTATVTLEALSASYNGTSKPATANTTPAGLVVNLTYDGSPDAPTNAGSYAVVATVSDANYIGAASGTLVIAKGEATVTLENLVQIRDGSAKHATAITDPPGLTVEFTYSPSAGAPVETGNYTVMGTIRDANFSGSAIGTLALLSSPTISVQPASVLASQGAPVTFRVEADGNNLVYQWQKDGVNIEGAISASLTIAQAQLVDVGSYSAMISNVVGSITSAPAVLIASFGPGDNDGDGLTNDEEIVVYHTNPNQSDTDGDGLTDGYEAGLGRFSVLLGTFTWDQARLSAIAEGGNLATFTSEAEWDLALWSLGFEALFDVNGLWVGASDAAVEGTWGWVTGEAFSFAPWAVGQPDNLNNSDYAAVAGDLGGDSGKWYDFRKATTRDGYILETGYTTDPTVADADGDGLNDSQEQAAGSNPFTADTDGDGLTDGEEVQQSRTHPRLADSNSDGTNDSADDADGDGLSNLTEIRSNLTNPVLADTDGDGLGDGAEVNSHRTNPLVADTDGDGYSDGYEVAMASDPVKAGSVPTFTLTLSDGGMVTGGSFYLTGSLAHGTTATLKAVADAGYVFSNWTGNLAGSVDPQTLLMDENKSVGATFIPDTQDADDDGLTNYQESVTYGTNPNLGDTDADGLTDAAELQVNLTNPKVPDTDGDGLTDGSEISVTGTNPLVADTDGDSYLDGYEEANSSNPKSADSFPTYGLQLEAGGEMVGGRFSKSGSLGHGTQAQLTALAAEGYLFMGWTGDLSGAVNPQLLLMDSNKTVGASFVNDTRDSDADGLTNYEEVVVYGTNPVLADSDADGLSDGSENQTDHTNPLLADTDGDGLSDGVEVLIQHTNPLVADTDGDGHSDGYEVANASDPVSSVSFPTFVLRLGDGGKVTGGSFSQTGSLAHGGSVVLTALADAGYVFSVWTGDLTGATNPQTLRMDGDKAVGATFIHDILDTDGDGLTNFEEAVTYGTSPSLTDTDGDGLSDSAEIRTHQTNPSRADSNGDGLADGVAVRMGLEPLADHAALVRIILDSRETFGLHTLQDLTDLRPGSTTVKVLPSAGGLQLRLKVQQSADLKNWQDAGEAVFEQTVDPTVQKKFFRFGVE